MPELILVVDDSLIQRKIFASTLKAAGYQVIAAENGRQGLELALQQRPALILMDILMPEMDGPSAVRELPTYPEMAKVPILAVTAASDPAELREARQAGYNDCLGKADRAALVDKVRQWLLDSP